MFIYLSIKMNIRVNNLTLLQAGIPGLGNLPAHGIVFGG